MIERADLKTYFEEAKRWDQDRLAKAERSKRLAWTVAAVASGVAVAACVAVAMLSPLKSVEPFVVRVNETTGYIDVMTALTSDEDVTYDETIQRYWLGRYVRSRETYAFEEQRENFREVALLSAPAEQDRWADYFSPDNPQSPQNLLGRNGRAEVEITSISFLNDEVANVRFRKTTERPGGEVTRTNWIATITFGYTTQPMSEADRLVNPLGFQVFSYRADPEVVE